MPCWGFTALSASRRTAFVLHPGFFTLAQRELILTVTTLPLDLGMVTRPYDDFSIMSDMDPGKEPVPEEAGVAYISSMSFVSVVYVTLASVNSQMIMSTSISLWPCCCETPYFSLLAAVISAPDILTV